MQERIKGLPTYVSMLVACLAASAGVVHAGQARAQARTRGQAPPAQQVQVQRPPPLPFGDIPLPPPPPLRQEGGMGSVTPESVKNAFQALRAPVPDGQPTDNQGVSGTTDASATLPATTMAQPAQSRTIPFMFGGNLPVPSLDTPESMSNGIQVQDEAARGRVAPTPVPVPAPAPVAVSAQAVARAPASTVRQGGGMSACGNGALSDMLSPSCLAVLGSISPGNVTAAPSPTAPSAPQAQPSLTCTVSLFTAGGNVPTTSTFPAPDLQSCLVAGTKLSHGIMGMSNIVAITPQWGVMGVTCMRDARGIKCEPQS